MKRQVLKELFSKITVWKRGGQRAPHKPLLVLYALGRCLRGEGRLIAYSTLDPDLNRLLREFGPTRKSYHPEYPFWRLQNNGIWQLRGAEKVKVRKSGTDAKKSELLRYNVQGGFTKEIYADVATDHKLIAEIAEDLLEANFPASIHEDILQAVGLDLAEEDFPERKRDPYFRHKILKACEYRCAAFTCGWVIPLLG
jgi:putative restriction endonuclease